MEVSEPHKRQVLGCRLPQSSTVNLLLGRGADVAASMRPDFRRKLYPELLKLLGSANASQIQVRIIPTKIRNAILIFQSLPMKIQLVKSFLYQ